MTGPDLPDSVPFERIEAFLARAGIPIRDLFDIHIERAKITVVHARRDDQDRRIVVGDEFSTTVTYIPITR